VRVKIVKNKMAAPFRMAEFDLLFKEGISTSGEILDMAVDKGLVQKSGTWFSMGDERLGQGRENARQFLMEHPEMLEKLAGEVKKAAGLAVEAPASTSTDEAEADNGKPAAATKGATRRSAATSR
jgi:recombination protein RecA